MARAGTLPGNCWLQENPISMPRKRPRAIPILRVRRTRVGRRASWKPFRAAPDHSRPPVEAPGGQRFNAFLLTKKHRTTPQPGRRPYEPHTDKIRSYRRRIFCAARSLNRLYEPNDSPCTQNAPRRARLDPGSDGWPDGYACGADRVENVRLGSGA